MVDLVVLIGVTIGCIGCAYAGYSYGKYSLGERIRDIIWYEGKQDLSTRVHYVLGRIEAELEEELEG